MAGAPRGGARAACRCLYRGRAGDVRRLGAALLAARAAGAAAGWGFQFQSPVFVAGMAWLLFAVGLNLSGVFQVGTGLCGTGQGLAARRGHPGSFFTGLLAVLVATPCTAPFMGVAIAAGLAAPPAVTMLVFLAMGLGLAAPYAVLATVPGARARDAEAGALDGGAEAGAGIPDVRRERLAGVGGQPGGRPSGVLGTAAGLVLLGFAAWVLGITQGAAGRSRRIGQSAAAAACWRLWRC